jgi:hypothetical protein
MARARTDSIGDAAVAGNSRVLRVRNQLKAKGADGSLRPLKHPQKRLSEPLSNPRCCPSGQCRDRRRVEIELLPPTLPIASHLTPDAKPFWSALYH